MKRVVSLLILLAMLIHGASRVGLLSYIYTNKARISYALGLLDEKPITMCDKDFHTGDRLTLGEDISDKTIPHGLPVAPEIKLFLSSVSIIVEPISVGSHVNLPTHCVLIWPDGYRQQLLHPPIFS